MIIFRHSFVSVDYVYANSFRCLVAEKVKEKKISYARISFFIVW